MSERVIRMDRVVAEFDLQNVLIVQHYLRRALNDQLLAFASLRQNSPAGRIFFGMGINHGCSVPQFAGIIGTSLLEAGPCVRKDKGLGFSIRSHDGASDSAENEVAVARPPRPLRRQ